jgi:hypothetical protein
MKEKTPVIRGIFLNLKRLFCKAKQHFCFIIEIVETPERSGGVSSIISNY